MCCWWEPTVCVTWNSFHSVQTSLLAIVPDCLQKAWNNLLWFLVSLITGKIDYTIRVKNLAGWKCIYFNAYIQIHLKIQPIEHLRWWTLLTLSLQTLQTSPTMEPSGSFLLLVSMAYLFIFTGEYYIYDKRHSGPDHLVSAVLMWCDVVNDDIDNDDN